MHPAAILVKVHQKVRAKLERIKVLREKVRPNTMTDKDTKVKVRKAKETGGDETQPDMQPLRRRTKNCRKPRPTQIQPHQYKNGNPIRK